MGAHIKMTDKPDTGCEEAVLRLQRTMLSVADVSDWFVREVLPLEAILIHFLQHNWQNENEIVDLRQEVYLRVFEAAQQGLPEYTKRFVLTTARNLLIDRVRREQVVPIDAVADVEAMTVAIDAPGPDRIVMAREELRRLQLALDRLPPRCREAVILAHIEGLSGKEIAHRMGISEATVSRHLSNGIDAFTDMLFGEPVDRARKS